MVVINKLFIDLVSMEYCIWTLRIRPVANRNRWMAHTRIKGRGLNLDFGVQFCIFFGSEFSGKISESRCFVVFSREDTVHKPSMALYAVEFNSEIEVQK